MGGGSLNERLSKPERPDALISWWNHSRRDARGNTLFTEKKLSEISKITIDSTQHVRFLMGARAGETPRSAIADAVVPNETEIEWVNKGYPDGVEYTYGDEVLAVWAVPVGEQPAAF